MHYSDSHGKDLNEVLIVFYRGDGAICESSIIKVWKVLRTVYGGLSVTKVSTS